MVRKLGSLLAVLLLVILAVWLARQTQQAIDSGRPTQAALSSPPDFVGWVMAVNPGSSQIEVESQADKIVRPVTVHLTEDTTIFRREQGILRQVDISEVYLQDQAELWLIGTIPSSFPADVNARQVIVENPYKQP